MTPAPRSCTVVLPALNEAPSLAGLIAEIIAAAPAAGLSPLRVLVVDDGSTDGTWAEIKTVANQHGDIVHGIRLRRTWGKSVALATGFTRCDTELVATLDADGQDDPIGLSALRNRLDQGCDLVTGWKADRRDPWSRRLASSIFNGVVRSCTGLQLHDMNCGFKLMHRSVAQELAVQLTSELHRYQPVLAHTQGYRVGEAPVPHRARQHGRSRFGWERYPRGAFDLFTVLATSHYGRRPGHLFGWMGLLTGGAGFLILAYLTVLWFQGHRPIGNRPLFSLGILLVVVGVQFFSLGFLAGLLRRPATAATPPGLIAEERNGQSTDQEPK